MERNLELMIKNEEIDKIIQYVKDNKGLIENLKKRINRKSVGVFDSDVKEEISFNFMGYQFPLSTEYHEYFDTRNDDGVTAGWTPEGEVKTTLKIIPRGYTIPILSVSELKSITEFKNYLLSEFV